MSTLNVVQSLGGDVSGDAVCTHNVLQDVGWVGAIQAHTPELASGAEGALDLHEDVAVFVVNNHR